MGGGAVNRSSHLCDEMAASSDSMEFKSELLLELERDRQGVCNLYGLAVVTTGLPFWHRLNEACSFFVEGRVATAEHSYVFNVTGF